MKLQYGVRVRDSADQSDGGVATSQDVVTPPAPGPGRYVLNLSNTAFNPATGRNDIVIGGGFRPPGLNATQFGSSDIDALIHLGKPRVRIHYSGTADTNRSINLVPNFNAGPGEVIHCRGTWLFEADPAIQVMRKWLYFLRGDTESLFVLSNHGSAATLGPLHLTCANPRYYLDGTGVRQKKYVVAPASAMPYSTDLTLEFWLRINSAAFVADGGCVVNMNGVETFRDTAMIPVETPKAVKGGPVKPLTIWKFGQQSQGEPQTQNIDEWRYINDGLLIEKVAALP